MAKNSVTKKVKKTEGWESFSNDNEVYLFLPQENLSKQAGLLEQNFDQRKGI